MPEAVGLALLRAIITWDSGHLDAVLAELDIPLLVIQSTILGADRLRRPLRDGETGPYQRLLLDRVAGAKSESLPQCGHFCMIEAPDVVNARIGRFIAAL